MVEAPEEPGDEVVGPDDNAGTPGLPDAPVVGGEVVKGVFVSASKGAASGDGTRLRPLTTIAAAIPLAKAKGDPVIVCAETYPEQVVLSDGVTLFGFFDCDRLDAWKRSPDKRAKVVSPTSPAVLGENLTIPARFEGFEVESPDMPGSASAGVPAQSSYGMVLRHSKNLNVGHVSILAGSGQDGADGVEPASGNVERSPQQAGTWKEGQRLCTGDANLCHALAGFSVTGATGGYSSCTVGPNGGYGGQGGNGPVSMNGALRYVLTGAEKSGKPYGASTLGTAQGAPALGNLASVKGSDGSPGATGTLGSNGEWSFDLSGFRPGDGKAGENGTPGQGGGGGAGTGAMWFAYDRPMTTSSLPDAVLWGAVGAGGGAGGCGGLAGSAGTGGGASVGVLLIGSDAITLDSSRVATKKGGRGGRGTLGTLGLPGGAGGPGEYVGPGPQEPRPSGLYGGAGGRGGAGGAAGLGGHGAPGPSVALAFTGQRPVVKATTLVTGSGGDGSPVLSRGQQTLPATSGIAKSEHMF